jgi:hypothetical protein
VKNKFYADYALVWDSKICWIIRNDL